ncbi:MAG: hypothetical protein QW607_01960 [Desulfurococcaceae archaeon]
MRFPPQSIKEWIKWMIYPRFPRKVLFVYSREGSLDGECYDEEIDVLVRTRNLTVVRCTHYGDGEEAWRSWGTIGGDPFQFSENISPSEIFGVYTTRWSMGYFMVMYTMLMFGLIDVSILTNMWWILIVLFVYMITNIQRFNTPSIRYLVTHVIGNVGGLPLIMPGPTPQSVLSMSQLMKTLKQPELAIQDETISELVKEIEGLKEVNKRLYGLIIRIEKESDRIYDVVHKLGEELSHSVVEEIREGYERLLTRRTKIMVLLMIVTLILGLMIGFLLGNVTSVGVVSPP